MKLNHRQGFTFIEVLVSVLIFAIISVGFFTMFTTVFINHYKSAEVTENAFLAQRNMEDAIAQVKAALNNGVAVETYDSQSITLFSGTNARTVTSYYVTQSSGVGPSLEIFISSTRPPQLRVPVITGGVSIEAQSGGNTIKYPSVGLSGLSVDLADDLVVDNPGLLIRYVYYWYVSKPNEYIPSSPPAFPDDYEIIREYTSSTIPTIPESYGGRFLKLLVTPVGEKGQMGASVQSNALYISPLPVTSNLLFRADASYIDLMNTTMIRTTTSGGIVTRFVKLLPDLASNGLDLKQTTSNNQPILNQITLGTDDVEHEVYTISGSAASTNMHLITAKTPAVSSVANMTVYFAAKFEDAFPNSTTIMQTRSSDGGSNRFIFGTNASGNLVLTRYLGGTNAANTKTLTAGDYEYRASQWRIFKLSIYQDRLMIEVDGESFGTLSYSASSQTMYLTDFRINFNANFTLGEILIYDTTHAADSTQDNAIMAYLAAKYQP